MTYSEIRCPECRDVDTIQAVELSAIALSIGADDQPEWSGFPTAIDGSPTQEFYCESCTTVWPGDTDPGEFAVHGLSTEESSDD